MTVSYSYSIIKIVPLALGLTREKHLELILAGSRRRRLLLVAAHDLGGVVHHLGRGADEEHQMTLVVHGQLHPGAHQAMEHGGPLQIQPALQGQLPLLHRARERHIRGTPQHKLQHGLGLGQRLGSLLLQDVGQDGRDLGGGQHVGQRGVGALAQRAHGLVVVVVVAKEGLQI